MRALKTCRADLGAHLAAGLGAKAPKLGAQVNPPAVIVHSGGEYVTALDYCTDQLNFEVTIAAPAGDDPAVADALDDLIDQVRATLRGLSPAGLKYKFVNVSGYTTIKSGDLTLPAVIASIGLERQVD